MVIEEHISLSTYNTLSINATARYAVRVTSLNDAIAAVTFATTHALPILVLGEGSNVVLTQNWSGMVIFMEMQGTTILKKTSTDIHVHIAAGELWHEAVVRTVSSGWYGLENLALIPGTVGAAPVQNIGAYGKEISDTILYVEAISLKDGAVYRFTRDACHFSYRHSIFHGQCPNKWLITGIALQLHTSPTTITTYPSLNTALQEDGIDPAFAHPTQVMAAVIRIRESKLPHPSTIPNVGSFFKNPILTQEKYTHLCSQFPHMPAHPVDMGWKVPAAWLIEQIGGKEMTYHGVSLYAHNALVLINPNHCSGDTVIKFAKKIQQRVDRQFGILLEIEPLII